LSLPVCSVLPVRVPDCIPADYGQGLPNGAAVCHEGCAGCRHGTVEARQEGSHHLHCAHAGAVHPVFSNRTCRLRHPFSNYSLPSKRNHWRQWFLLSFYRLMP